MVTVPRAAESHVMVNDVPGMVAAEFATVVESDAPVVVDRADVLGRRERLRQSLGGGGAVARHRSGIWPRAPRIPGFDLFYLLQNPSPTATPT